ncbi:cytochrome C oxidase subunit IV family protein [Nocardia miyunensis]|uniref:cytochrome C oxidase subunit IV family protein n=1 Tax=Nocardia miyunensis TaxID=282684 RepID=UPI00082A26C0|nr:cytochrome C oxidase subunit IV family protein [Nocardia miyunensis]
MTRLIANKETNYVVGAWLVLMVLTGATWIVGGDHAFAGLSLRAAMISILVLTFAKIYVVGNAFMEMRDAAPWLARTFTIWCIALCTALSALYLWRA